MPRKNRRNTPPSSHKLSRFERWAKAVISENQGQGQRIINNRKKGGETYAET
jgi:hypothetical protein